MQQWILVAVGGAVGSLLRAMVQRLLPHANFPFATFAVNIAGSFLIGALWALLLKGSLPASGRAFWMTGLCGGFTTFSALSLEGLQLLQSGRIGMFVFYFGASMLLGLLAVFIGYKLFY